MGQKHFLREQKESIFKNSSLKDALLKENELDSNKP